MNVYIFHYNTFEEFGVRKPTEDGHYDLVYDILYSDPKYPKLKTVFDLMGGKKGVHHGVTITAEEYESITGEKICPTS